MKRRVLALALLLVTLCPLAARSDGGAMDPNGLAAPAPELTVWLDSAVQLLLAWLGV
ncbi:MAG TPA: hypothetical protein VLF66_11085 [Thermoanaerobaculia bacterium]|nr:hypothetical protein [Thermoanaerobaculia bacterium]